MRGGWFGDTFLEDDLTRTHPAITFITILLPSDNCPVGPALDWPRTGAGLQPFWD